MPLLCKSTLCNRWRESLRASELIFNLSSTVTSAENVHYMDWHWLILNHFGKRIIIIYTWMLYFHHWISLQNGNRLCIKYNKQAPCFTQDQSLFFIYDWARSQPMREDVTCNVFSHWLRPCSAIDRKQAQQTASIIHWYKHQAPMPLTEFQLYFKFD